MKAAAALLALALLPLSDGGFGAVTRQHRRQVAAGRNASGAAAGAGSAGGRRVGPVPDASQPWWLNDAPLQNETGPLPEDADIVIIGAGMTGASIAHHLAQLDPARAAGVLVLDARGAAGGATGRNGGQINPMDCYEFEDSIEDNGLEEALAERAFQFAGKNEMLRYVEERGVEADLRMGGQAVNWFTSGERAAGESAHATCLRNAEQCGDPSCGLSETLDAEEAEERMRSPDLLGAAFLPVGGGVWGGRIVFSLLEDAIERGVTLRTQTLVTSVERADRLTWLVHTERGTVRAPHVVFATNGYTDTLVPELEGDINPYRNQVVITEPAPLQWDFINWFSGPAPAGSSYVYHMQREDGRLVIGANAEPGSQSDDATDSVSPEVTERLLDEMREVYPALAGVEAEQSWMGVLSWTSDGFPWVGELPSFRGEAAQGLYVAAGFGGEGMVRCFASGKAVAEMLTGREPSLFNSRYLPSARGKH